MQTQFILWKIKIINVQILFGEYLILTSIMLLFKKNIYINNLFIYFNLIFNLFY